MVGADSDVELGLHVRLTANYSSQDGHQLAGQPEQSTSELSGLALPKLQSVPSILFTNTA